jgi:hypothetical protein
MPALTPLPPHTSWCRESLRLIAANSTAVGLPQPHLDRTRLCQLGDDALEPAYVAKREGLKRLIRSLARPKARRCSRCRRPGSCGSAPAAAGLLLVVGTVRANRAPTHTPQPHPLTPNSLPPSPSAQVVQGRALDGPGLADLVQQVVEGLNDRDIPTGGGPQGWQQA